MLGIIAEHLFARDDFRIASDGTCRLNPQLARYVAARTVSAVNTPLSPEEKKAWFRDGRRGKQPRSKIGILRDKTRIAARIAVQEIVR